MTRDPMERNPIGQQNMGINDDDYEDNRIVMNPREENEYMNENTDQYRSNELYGANNQTYGGKTKKNKKKSKKYKKIKNQKRKINI